MPGRSTQTKLNQEVLATSSSPAPTVLNFLLEQRKQISSMSANESKEDSSSARVNTTVITTPKKKEPTDTVDALAHQTHQKGIALAKEGRLVEAINALRKAIETYSLTQYRHDSYYIFMNVFHADLAFWQNEYGVELLKKDHNEQAINIFDEALKACGKTGYLDTAFKNHVHANLAGALLAHATTLEENNRYSESAALLLRAKTNYEKVTYPAKDFKSKLNLRLAYAKTENPTTPARLKYKDYEDVVRASIEYATLLKEEKNFKYAIELLKEATVTNKKITPLNQKLTEQVYSELIVSQTAYATFLDNNQKFSEAALLLKSALESCEKLGPSKQESKNNIYTLLTFLYKKQAEILYKKDDFYNANCFYNHAILMYMKVNPNNIDFLSQLMELSNHAHSLIFAKSASTMQTQTTSTTSTFKP